MKQPSIAISFVRYRARSVSPWIFAGIGSPLAYFGRPNDYPFLVRPIFISLCYGIANKPCILVNRGWVEKERRGNRFGRSKLAPSMISKDAVPAMGSVLFANRARFRFSG